MYVCMSACMYVRQHMRVTMSPCMFVGRVEPLCSGVNTAAPSLGYLFDRQSEDIENYFTNDGNSWGGIIALNLFACRMVLPCEVKSIIPHPREATFAQPPKTRRVGELMDDLECIFKCMTLELDKLAEWSTFQSDVLIESRVPRSISSDEKKNLPFLASTCTRLQPSIGTLLTSQSTGRLLDPLTIAPLPLANIVSAILNSEFELLNIAECSPRPTGIRSLALRERSG